MKRDWQTVEVVIETIEGETPQAYEAFLTWCWLQGSDRTYEELCKRLNYPATKVQQWAFRYDWAKRVNAVDASRWLQRIKEQERLVEADNRRYVNANRENKEQLLQLSKKAIHLANGLMEKALDGTLKAKVSDIPRLIEVALKTTRGVNDLPTEFVERNVANAVIDIEALSNDEIMALRHENKQKLLARGIIETGELEQ